MCFGGGSNRAAEEAQRAEAERQAQIQEAQKRVESIFGSPAREAQVEDLVGATRGFLQEDLDRQHKDTSRNLKFSVARSGLAGGSTDIDQNRRLAEKYLRGTLEVERRANTAGATLRSQDSATKAGLFSQILGGLDSSTAATEAARSLQNNVAMAKSDAYQQGIGDLFGDFADIFKLSREAAGERRQAFDFNTLYAPRPGGTPAGNSGYYGS